MSKKPTMRILIPDTMGKAAEKCRQLIKNAVGKLTIETTPTPVDVAEDALQGIGISAFSEETSVKLEITLTEPALDFLLGALLGELGIKKPEGESDD